MRTYLKIINPVVAVVTLLLCAWAAMSDGSKFNAFGIVEGSFGTYFFAKGLFTCSTLLLLGQILLLTVARQDRKVDPKTTLSDVFYLVVLFGVVISSLVGVIMFKHYRDRPSREKQALESLAAPPQIKVTENYLVKESRNLKIICRLRNDGDFDWDEVEVCAELSFSGKFAGRSCVGAKALAAGQETVVEIRNDDYATRDVLGSLSYALKVSGKKTP